jgi:formate hydrogenlyase subunit 3/multisubunit Na+/H+ antiporter MnhD subunit
MIELDALQQALVPVWLPLVAVPLVYLVRRYSWLAALLAAGIMAVVVWWLLERPMAPELQLLGRPLFLSPMARMLLIALAGWLAAAFLFSWRISQGWSLFPFLLLVYALIATALFFDELLLQVLVLKIAWLVVTLLVQGGAVANTRAATRLLILSVLALPPFLLATALIAQRIYQPDATALTEIIVLLLGMGFVLMLAVIPFHAWLPQAAEDGPPLVAAWLVAGMGSSYLVLLFELLTRYAWLAENAQVQRMLLGGGLLLAVSGALLAVTERHLGRLWAYVVLADLGYILLALSFNTQVGQWAALLVIGSRLLSVLLAGAALATIRHRATTLDFDGLLGVGARLPVTTAAFAVGGLAMLGVPLTAGFPGHWTVLRLLSESGSGWIWLLLGAALAGIIGFLRALAVMTAPAEPEQVMRVEQEPRTVTLFLLFLILVSLVIGVAPHLVEPVLANLV